MAVRIKIGNASIEVDTASDLKQVLGILSSETGSNGKQLHFNMTSNLSATAKWTEFYQRLKPLQKEFVDHLRANPEGVTDVDVRKKLGIETNKGLGGFLGGFSKQGEPFGIKGKSLIIRKDHQDRFGSRFWFTLSKDAKEAWTSMQ